MSSSARFAFPSFRSASSSFDQHFPSPSSLAATLMSESPDRKARTFFEPIPVLSGPHGAADLQEHGQMKPHVPFTRREESMIRIHDLTTGFEGLHVPGIPYYADRALVLRGTAFVRSGPI